MKLTHGNKKNNVFYNNIKYVTRKNIFIKNMGDPQNKNITQRKLRPK